MRLHQWVYFVAAWWGLGPAASQAQPPVIIENGHVDIFAAGWEPANPPGPPDQRWFIHVHDHDGDEEYAPHEAWLFVRPGALQSRPPGSQWDFLGTGAGQNIWVLPQVQDPNLIFGGMAAEEIDPGTFDTYALTDPRVNNGNPTNGEWIHIRLRDVSGPGHFSVWQTDTFGSPVVWMSSFANGIDSTDFALLMPGGHIHFNWGFTEAGFYDVTIEFEALLNGDVTRSGEYTYTFVVHAIPEPATIISMLAGGGMLGLAWHRRRASPQAKCRITAA